VSESDEIPHAGVDTMPPPTSGAAKAIMKVMEVIPQQDKVTVKHALLRQSKSWLFRSNYLGIIAPEKVGGLFHVHLCC